ncbi:MAG: hypothetical protein ACI3W7_03955 [Oscillospiraceae bacterium]
MGRCLEHQYAEEAEHFLYHTIPALAMQDSDPDAPPSTAVTVPIEHQDLLDAMREYNRRIFEEKQTGLCDAWAMTTPASSSRTATCTARRSAPTIRAARSA